MKRLALLPWLVGLALSACTTRVVDLPLPDAAPGMPGDTGRATATTDGPVTCEMVVRADGANCRLCFAADGTVVNGTCDPLPMMPVPDVAPGIPMCTVVPKADLRCRVCSSAMGAYTACLTCQEAAVLGGERCRPCVWSDLPEQRCLQCFGADGGVSHDDCDNFRKEVVAPGGV